MEKFLLCLSENSDTVTAVAAVLISFCSLLFTSLNIFSQRRHNRISIMPIGVITVGDYEDNIFVRLHNYGVGPMIIESLRVSKTETGEEVGNALIDCVTELPSGHFWRNFVEKADGRVVSKDGHITLLHFESETKNAGFSKIRDRIRRELSELTITVEYKDVYGHRMKNTTRSLEWFARNL